MEKPKLVRITTVPISLEKLLEDQLKYMSDYYEVTAISSDNQRLIEFGKQQEIHTFHLDLTRKITPFKDLSAMIKLYKFLKKEKPYIVHTHTPKAGVVGMLAAYLAKVPNRMHTVAGMPLLEVVGLKRSVLNFVEKLTYLCATKVYPNSYGLQEIIIDNNFVSKEKMKVIAHGSSNGINMAYFDPELFGNNQNQVLRESLNIEINDFVFIFVGRIVSDKGINELIDAFSKLSCEFDNVKLLLVGGLEDDLDPLLDVTKKQIEGNDDMISVGYQQDVRPYFSIANVLVFPSYREGFPNVVMQAGAMGIPSIVSDINGCNEIIKENVNGFIVPVKNSNSIQEAMKKSIVERVLISNMKGSCRSLIAEKYKRQVVWDAILKEYKKC